MAATGAMMNSKIDTMPRDRKSVKETILGPHVFHSRPEFLMISGVYTAIYAPADIILTSCVRSQADTWPKFIGTTIANTTTVVAKPRPVPILTYLLFTARDAMTVAASFNTSSPVSKYLQERFGMSGMIADFTTQLECSASI